MSWSNYLGFGKISNFFNLVKSVGGFKNAILSILRTEQLKSGQLVGVDKFGNKYYQNNYYFYGTNRWVIYSDRFGYDYDASQVPAEWYGWLHYKTDLVPSQVTSILLKSCSSFPFILYMILPKFYPAWFYMDKSRPKYKWMAEHTENYSGTPYQYTPYSTTRRKIEGWVPPKPSK